MRNYKEKFERSELLLSIHKDKIESMIQLTESVNKNSSSKEIVKILAENLLNLMKVRHVLFIYKEFKWINLLNYGTFVSIEEIKLNLLKNVSKATKTSKINNPLIQKFSHILPVRHKEENIAYMFIKDIEIGDIDCSEDEKIRYIEALLSITIISLENKRLFKEFKKEKKLEVEMKMAAEVQHKLIPKNFPKGKNYTFSGKYIPHSIVGGDYYDLIPIDESNIAFCMCDISGKGFSAGMLMSNFQASIRTLLSRKVSLKELVKTLNIKFLNISKNEHFISMFIAMYNTKTRKLQYINAGHNHPVLKNRNKIKNLEKGCTVLGFVEELPFINIGEEILENNALLVMYTDGVSELLNNKEEEFGTKRIENFVKSNDTLELQDFNNRLIEELENYKEQKEFFDDVSILSAKFYYDEL